MNPHRNVQHKILLEIRPPLRVAFWFGSTAMCPSLHSQVPIEWEVNFNQLLDSVPIRFDVHW